MAASRSEAATQSKDPYQFNSIRRDITPLFGLAMILLSCAAVLRAQGQTPSASKLQDGNYHNLTFSFSYKPPYGWVDRTRQMQDDSADPAKAQVLVATFERPPEASDDSIDSAVIIATESVKAYPGLKTAADYFGPLTEVSTAKGFKVVNEPYEVNIGAKTMVRSDFSKELGKLTMHQASLVMLAKGYVVSFTFIGSSQDEVESLIGGLSFAASGSKR